MHDERRGQLRLLLNPQYIQPKLGTIYLGLLFSALAYAFLSWPIYAGDADLWFHLSGGRFIFTSMSIPDNSYFSFISPAKKWIDYYWGFQALVYPIHALTDYHGLVVLRALLYLATILMVWRLASRNDPRSQSLFAILIIVLTSLLLIPRFFLVRPHMFSYLFIPVCLWILESDSKRRFVFPLLALVWVNLHGMEFPVILLIAAAYLADWLYVKLKTKECPSKSELIRQVPLLIAVVTPLCTPFGVDLLRLPFTFSQETSLYIDEMRRLTLADLTTFQVTGLTPTHSTLFNAFLILALFSLAIALLRKRVRASHLILFAGGLYLLTQGLRFKYEFSLLALPLLSSQLGVFSPKTLLRKPIKPGMVIPVAALGLLPFLYVKNTFRNAPKYPFSSVNLPEGVTTFLHQVNVGGSVLNMPEVGGYLHWRLYPRYRIFMDMQMSMFDDADYFRSVHAYTSEAVLANLISEYKPSFIAAYLNHRGFKRSIAKFPRYVPIFFDDASILYVDQENNPDLANSFALREIDPYEIAARDLNKAELVTTGALTELTRIHTIYPRCGLVNESLSKVALNAGDYRQALQHADQIIDAYPQLARGYTLRADALVRLSKFDDAVAALRGAFEKSNGSDRSSVSKKLWFCYTKLERHEQAYEALREAVNPFARESRHEEIFNLASSAAMIGKWEESHRLLEFANAKVPEDDAEWRRRIQEMLALMGVESPPPKGISPAGG